MLDQVAESQRTRQVKEGVGSFVSVSAAFDPAGLIHLENPGLLWIELKYSFSGSVQPLDSTDIMFDQNLPGRRHRPRCRSSDGHDAPEVSDPAMQFRQNCAGL